jgi:hypothetical protein
VAGVSGYRFSKSIFLFLHPGLIFKINFKNRYPDTPNRHVPISIFKIDFEKKCDFLSRFQFSKLILIFLYPGFNFWCSIFKIDSSKLILVGGSKSILAANLIDFDSTSRHRDFAWEGHGGVQEAVGGEEVDVEG